MRGFTLLELLIASVLSLLIVVMIVYSYRVTEIAYAKFLEKRSQRYFLEIYALFQQQLVAPINLSISGNKISYETTLALTHPYASVSWEFLPGRVIYRETVSGKDVYVKEFVVDQTSFISYGDDLFALKTKQDTYYLRLIKRDRIPIKYNKF